MTELQLLKTLIFLKVLTEKKKSSSSYLKLFSVSIIKKMTFIVSVKTLNKKLKKIKAKLRKLRHSKKEDILKNVQKTKCLNEVT